jgi:hypothetical protein
VKGTRTKGGLGEAKEYKGKSEVVLTLLP